MAQADEWGPPLWRILHTLAERLGRQTIPLLATDERRAWVGFLRSIEGVMPCAKCRAHYRAWRLKNPVEKFINAYDLKETAREWLWTLHTEVNTERGVMGPALEEIPALYGNRTGYEIQDDINKVLQILQTATLQRTVTGDAVRTFRKALELLQRISG